MDERGHGGHGPPDGGEVEVQGTPEGPPEPEADVDEAEVSEGDEGDEGEDDDVGDVEGEQGRVGGRAGHLHQPEDDLGEHVVGEGGLGRPLGLLRRRARRQERQTQYDLHHGGCFSYVIPI